MQAPPKPAWQVPSPQRHAKVCTASHPQLQPWAPTVANASIQAHQTRGIRERRDVKGAAGTASWETFIAGGYPP